MKIVYINSPKYGVQECLVDDEDYQWIIDSYGAYVRKIPNTDQFYVKCRPRPSPKKTGTSYLHRVIYSRYNALPDGKEIDHKDRNPLNNQKNNLRIATRTENTRNQGKIAKCQSQYKGVGIDFIGRWCSRIKSKDRVIHIGNFDSERDAAIAYDIAAGYVFGDFAVFNIVDASEEDRARIAKIMSNPKRISEGKGLSKYLYVTLNKATGRWQSMIKNPRLNKKVICGRFETELEAAVAADKYIDDNGLVELGVQKSLVPIDLKLKFSQS